MTPTDQTYLFVPGSRPERIVKAIAAGADAVIIDLEDAVAPAGKASALDGLRSGWASYANGAAAAGVTLLLRINASDTPWHEADVAASRELGIKHIVVPKAADVSVLAKISAAVPDVSLYPLIESAEGFDRLQQVARAAGVRRLLFGAVDLMLDLGIRDAGLPLHYFRTSIVLQSRLAGLESPVDGVCTDLEGAEALAAEVQRARDFGFGAKLLIHPKQVDAAQQGFAPSRAELEWAGRVVTAAASADGAAVAVDGEMVDRPVLLRAERLLGLRRPERQSTANQQVLS
jgi:citrate lyase subunit beta/citryl-CoA lyase